MSRIRGSKGRKHSADKKGKAKREREKKRKRPPRAAAAAVFSEKCIAQRSSVRPL